MLNLLAATDAAKAQGRDLHPKLFETGHLNRTLIVKQRLQGDEQLLFLPPRREGTKIIIPFVGRDLSLGGQTVLIGQRGWTGIVGDDRTDPVVQRDVALLKLLDEVPTLDPFLLREHLRRHGFEADLAYFSISRGDVMLMETYVAEQISPLIQLAFKDQLSKTKGQAARLALALISGDAGELLEPLRAALQLRGGDFGETVFCWKGVLYYKWRQGDVLRQVREMQAEMDVLSIRGPRPADLTAAAADALRRVRFKISDLCRDVDDMLRSYDAAFLALTEKRQPGPFHHFMKTAPDVFARLGRKLGSVAHVASQWRFRFPPAGSPSITVEELLQLLRDFEDDLEGVDGESEESFLI
ncbi:hypothetical protein [Caulobacter mirabilis]|uniref:Uncharacterized protein n=1 Tax=Caulobacter mirabilis TaxID=69666 RepID=A0A2D2B126_9CAUL|nr:hypothetical protein [Caulobacter mirabilis]ATQ43907.1 hypothetical protein CSW64_16635 [Caulobacter mirabilis]